MPKYNWQTSPEFGQKLTLLARQMRKEPTGAEAKLWQHIRKEQIRGVRFRRQHAIERFIPDFCSLELSLIIEVDGPIHQYTQAEDQIRQAFLESLGYEVLRFSNLEVFNNIRAVLDVIDEAVIRRKAAPPQPSPRGGSRGDAQDSSSAQEGGSRGGAQDSSSAQEGGSRGDAQDSSSAQEGG